MTTYRIDAVYGTEPIHATCFRVFGRNIGSAYLVKAASAAAALRKASKRLGRDASTLEVIWAGK